jgi:hypothetical protein
MIGGAGEKKTLRLVARHADATNMFAGPTTAPGDIQAKLDVLAEHCRREGTDYGRIRKTILWTAPVATDPHGARLLADQLSAFARIGIQDVHLMPFTGDPVAFIEELGKNVIPRIADL